MCEGRLGKGARTEPAVELRQVEQEPRLELRQGILTYEALPGRRHAASRREERRRVGHRRHRLRLGLRGRRSGIDVLSPQLQAGERITRTECAWRASESAQQAGPPHVKGHAARAHRGHIREEDRVCHHPDRHRVVAESQSLQRGLHSTRKRVRNEKRGAPSTHPAALIMELRGRCRRRRRRGATFGGEAGAGRQRAPRPSGRGESPRYPQCRSPRG